jgi:hypothetical protein
MYNTGQILMSLGNTVHQCPLSTFLVSSLQPALLDLIRLSIPKPAFLSSAVVPHFTPLSAALPSAIQPSPVSNQLSSHQLFSLYYPAIGCSPTSYFHIRCSLGSYPLVRCSPSNSPNISNKKLYNAV